MCAMRQIYIQRKIRMTLIAKILSHSQLKIVRNKKTQTLFALSMRKFMTFSLLILSLGDP